VFPTNQGQYKDGDPVGSALLALLTPSQGSKLALIRALFAAIAMHLTHGSSLIFPFKAWQS